MLGDRSEDMELLRNEIRRQFESPATQRFLRSHPVLRVESELPGDLDALLARLDRVEKRRAGQGERLG